MGNATKIMLRAHLLDISTHNKHEQDIKRLLASGRLELPCVTAADIRGIPVRNAVAMLEAGAVVDPHEARTSDICELYHHYKQTPYFRQLFHPATNNICSLMITVIENGDKETAEFVWNAMDELMRTAFRRDHLTKQGSETVAKWITDTGITPIYKEGLSQISKLWLVRFIAVPDLPTNWAFSTSVYKHQPASALIRTIKAHRLPKRGVTYIRNNIKYREYETADGMVLLDAHGNLINDVEPRLVEIRANLNRTICQDDGPVCSLEDLAILLDCGYQCDMHMIDDMGYYGSLLNSRNAAYLFYTAIHCNNLPALKMLLASEFTESINLVWLAISCFNDCTKYLLDMLTDDDSLREMVRALKNYYRPEADNAAIFALIAGVLPELSKFHSYSVDKASLRGYNDFNGHENTLLGTYVNILDDRPREAALYAEGIPCKYVVTRGELEDGHIYYYFVPTGTLIVETGPRSTDAAEAEIRRYTARGCWYLSEQDLRIIRSKWAFRPDLIHLIPKRKHPKSARSV
jgi:hypothetical protein